MRGDEARDVLRFPDEVLNVSERARADEMFDEKDHAHEDTERPDDNVRDAEKVVLASCFIGRSACWKIVERV